MAPDWLAPVKGALDLADGPCPIFFRDDDAGWDDARLELLLDLFDHHGAPIDVAVIPTELSPPTARRLLTRAGRSGVRRHQHGYAHVNHERHGRKCEFGTSRTAADQQRDIAAGRRRMLEAFGPLVDPVFTPPWNRCTTDTVAALVAEGFTVLSRDVTATPLERPELVEVAVTVDWMGHHKGVRWTRAELAARLAGNITSGGPVGVMLHHAQADDTEREAVAALLALLCTHPAAHLTNIAEIASNRRRTRGSPPS